MACFWFGFFFFHLSSFLSSLDAFYLSVPENYHYLNQSGCIVDKTISDKDSFKEVIVSCFHSSLCFKNAGGTVAWCPWTEEAKSSCAYLHPHRRTKLTGTHIFSQHFTVVLSTSLPSLSIADFFSIVSNCAEIIKF